MSRIDAPEDSEATMARMGYPNMIKATTFMSGDLPIEIGLIGPGGPYGAEWAVATHWDCDPDNDTQGTSRLSTHATLQEAEEEWRACVEEIEARLAPKP